MIDPTRDPVALTPADLAVVDALVTLLRSARAASVLVQLRQRLDERELRDLAWALWRAGEEGEG